MNPDYPKQMRHPNFIKGRAIAIAGTERMVGGVSTPDYQGIPDIFPPIEVSNADQEAQYRAKGYLAANENPAMAQYQRYPMWMRHPSGESALVSTEGEEAAYVERGFAVPGKPDPEAVHTAHSAPYQPNRRVSEWPKMVDGKLMQDPDLANRSAGEYPKWVGGKVVNNFEEERLLVEPAAPPADTEDERAKLLKQAAEANIKIDKRWSNERILEALTAPA